MRPSGERLSNLPWAGAPPNVTVAPIPPPSIFTSVAPAVDPRVGASDVTVRIAGNGPGTIVGAIGVDEPQPAMSSGRAAMATKPVVLMTPPVHRAKSAERVVEYDIAHSHGNLRGLPGPDCPRWRGPSPLALNTDDRDEVIASATGARGRRPRSLRPTGLFFRPVTAVGRRSRVPRRNQVSRCRNAVGR